MGPDGTIYVGSNDHNVYALHDLFNEAAAIENDKDTGEAPGAGTDEVNVGEEKKKGHRCDFLLPLY